MDNDWWDFDSGISSMESQSGEEETVLAESPLSMAVIEDMKEFQETIVPTGVDVGVIAGVAMTVISIMIMLLAVVALVLYRKILKRNETSMDFGSPVYLPTTEEKLPQQKDQLLGFQTTFSSHENRKPLALLQTV